MKQTTISAVTQKLLTDSTKRIVTQERAGQHSVHLELPKDKVALVVIVYMQYPHKFEQLNLHTHSLRNTRYIAFLSGSA